MKLLLCLLLLVPPVFSQTLEQLSALPKPTPAYQTDVDWCAKEGKDGDTELNVAKNRIDVPTNPSFYHPVKFAEIRDKKFVVGTTGDRSKKYQGKKKDLSPVYKYEGIPIRLEGYLLYQPANGDKGWIQEGEEACNCEKKDFDHIDYHLWLVEKKDDDIKKAVVVEITPRVRAVIRGRLIREDDLEKDLNFLAAQRIKVRMYGWLLFDGEHVNQLDKPGMNPDKVRRATLWEIHPITMVYSYQKNKWIKLY